MRKFRRLCSGRVFLQQQRPGHEGSLYLQDHVKRRQLTFDLGVRFDAYHFSSIGTTSPRLAMAYTSGKQGRCCARLTIGF